MRIIAGRYRSRRLETRAGNETRPTLDKVREAVFSSLGGMFDGGVVLDLYAGSGANGLEAISRGFARAVFVDIAKDAVAVIRRNIANLKCEEQSRVLTMSDMKALRLLAAEGVQFDLVYLDPPYARQHHHDILTFMQLNQMLKKDAVVVIESLKKEEFTTVYGTLRPYKEAVYGITRITYYRNEEEL